VRQEAAVVVRDVAKVYRRFLHKNQFRTLKSALLKGSLLSELRPDETFTALDSVSFEVPRGCTFGVIGENGSGKSTLLKLMAGITRPTRGSVSVAGRISALIELGAGFHPEISGRENVAINGIMLGLTRRQIEERFDEIVAFAELEDFIDAPVKTYSSGMYMRLGFAVAIHVDPDVLLIDEVLAVGDEAFTRKCLDKIGEFRRRGKTILLVTHSLGLVEKMCDEVLWLRHGRPADRGDPKRVVDAYLTYVAGGEEALLAKEHSQAGAAPETRAGETPQGYREGRWGSREVEITGVRLLDDRGAERHVYVPGESLTIALEVRAAAPVTDFVFGAGLFAADGVSVYGTNTHIEEFACRRLEGSAGVALVLEDLRLVEGTYLIDVAAHKKDGTPYDYHRGLHSFRVKSRIKDVGVYRPHHRWLFTAGAALDPPEPRPELDLHETESRDALQGPPEDGASTAGPAFRGVGQTARSIIARRRSWKEAGLRVVLTNGCFDLLHAGHVALLEAARGEGEVLVVAINSDASVRRIKGEDRPLLPEAERAEALAALEAVDLVVVYDDETPLGVIRSLAPDVLVKGADWSSDGIVGRELVEAAGGRVVRVELLPGRSTTSLRERILRS
jgi:rfaE bifunctional protein nucleotidyltransferase chain/domain